MNADLATGREPHSTLRDPGEAPPHPGAPEWCDGCALGKIKRKPAFRVPEDLTDAAKDPALVEQEETWGNRLDADLSGRTEEALGKEVCAYHQKDQETEYAGVEGLVSKEPEVTTTAFNEHNANGQPEPAT